MNLTMKKRVEAYLNDRRHLGSQLKHVGAELFRFAKYADKKGHRGPLTTAIAIEWARSSKKSTSFSRARRLELTRCFAKYYYVFEPNTEIPPSNIFGPTRKRSTPYIYSTQEITDILTGSLQLNPRHGLRPITYYYLFGLLACTGLRIFEAIRLKRQDVDFTNGILTIRESKFYKSRYVPLHHTAIQALQKYITIRDKKICAQNESFFVLDNNLPVTTCKVGYAFKMLRKKIWPNILYKGRKPRIYDLRHTFVCRRLLAWHKEGKNIDQVIPFLSAYLGHVSVSNTYWYITGIPELMSIATKRFEQFYQQTI